MPPDEFHPENFPRAARHRCHLDVDPAITIPVLLARGASAGATLVVSANVHGDEYEGVRAIYEVFDELNPERMAGNLIAAPVLNPPAFWNGTRTSPLDGANLARVFPGDPEGAPSQRLAWHFGKSILARADFYLDLHSGGVQFRMPSMAGYPLQDARSRAAAELFGAPVIWGHATIAPGRTVSRANELGIPWLYTEARGAGRIHPEDLEMMKRGMRNLLRHLRILDTELEAAPLRMRLLGDGNTDEGLCSARDGFLIKQVEVLEAVTKGQPIGRLVDLTGVTTEEYRAPRDGVVGLVREFPVVRAKDVLFLMAELEKPGGE
jgi:predicted deacylase